MNFLVLFCFSYRRNSSQFVCSCEWSSREGDMGAEEKEEAQLSEVGEQLGQSSGSWKSMWMIHPQDQERRQPKRK